MTNGLVRPIKNIQQANIFSIKQPVYLLLLLCGTLFSAPACNADKLDQRFNPGVYEGLMLAVDGAGNLSGLYKESQGEGVVKTCSFFLTGKAAGGQAAITTWNTDHFPWVLKTEGNDLNLKIERGREHPGCGLVLLPEITTGIALTKTADAKWIKLNVVKHQRIALYSDPVEDKKTKSYFVKDDVLAALAEHGDWIHIEFPRLGKKSITEWIKADDVKELLPSNWSRERW